MRLFLLKILLTIPVTYGLLYPVLNQGSEKGMLEEIAMVGPIGAIAITVVFLFLVFLYCRDLQITLSLLTPNSRTASPKSVWLMFLIPYNFVEDFFIIHNIGKSLENESKISNKILASGNFGKTTGFGWCAAQIVSIVPNSIGMIGGLIAIPLWILHWRYVRNVIRGLKVES